MAATKVEKNAALAALTSAALSLPGLQAVAAVPAANIHTNVSYGHYEESDNRMKVDVYHADAVIPLTERIELSFSMDRDTYSGATPTFSIPTTLTNLPRYTTKGTEYADLVSAASGTFGGDKLTSPEGLETFISETNRQQDSLEINDKIDSLIVGLISTYLIQTSSAKIQNEQDVSKATESYETGANIANQSYIAAKTKETNTLDSNKLDKTNTYNKDKSTTLSQYQTNVQAANQQYQDTLASIGPQLPALFTQYQDNQTNLNLRYQSDYSQLDSEYKTLKSSLDSQYTKTQNLLDTQYNGYKSSLKNNKDTASTFDSYANLYQEPNSIKTSTTVDFGYNSGGTETVLTAGAYYGKANTAPLLSGACTEACVIQNDMVIGTIKDPVSTNAHLHQGGTLGDRAIAYHNDSGGIYIRALDSSAFSFNSVKFSSPYSAENPYAKYLADGVTPNPDHDPTLDYFEILGFNTALNPELASGNGTNYATRVAYQTIYNGFNNTLLLDPAFKNVKAIWIHYGGVPNVASATFPFKVQIDNIAVSPTTEWTSWKTTDYELYKNKLETQYTTDLAKATEKYNTDSNVSYTKYTSDLANVEREYTPKFTDLKSKYQTDQATLKAEYDAEVAKLTAGNEETIANASASRESKLSELTQSYNTKLALLTQGYNAQLAALDKEYDTKIAVLEQQRDTNLLELAQIKQTQISSSTEKYNTQIATLKTQKENELSRIAVVEKELQKQSKIASYRSLVDSLVPNGTPTVQRFSMQPIETRSMPQFTTRYYFDNTTLSFSGGLSDEPDFLSNFGSVNVSHEFNDKLTTVSGGYGKTSNVITRSASHAGHEGHSHYASPNYPELNESSDFDSFNLGLSQVLSKNTLFQSTINYANQQGYLSNPYKYVYIRGEVTPEEYYQVFSNLSGEVDWNSITKLEMVGIELFRENRPRERNLWSFSNRLNQHIPELDASVHFDYRFYIDDWNINSHTFELKWFQSLPGGFTVTPSLRYYSQSEAGFFAPYFLAPRADGYYSSDFRLSAFGNLAPGITLTKEFARGITLETGFEYTFHSGGLKLGGSGVGDYADFEYFMAHANLNIDFSARPFTVGGGAGDHHMHHHHHGAPIPAGVMFGHMMNQADEIMVGYRYQYGVQSGSMLHGSDQVSDALLVSNACLSNDRGCLYKPTKMHMQMHMLDLMYAPTDWLNIMIMPQLMSMDMTMSESLQSSQKDEHGGAKHNSNDIGDTLAVAMFKLMDDGTHHMHAGVGMSAPTGAIDAQLTPPALKSTSGTEIDPGSATLQDYGMQLGSGTWDFKPSLTYTGHVNDWGWGAQLSGTKRLDKNKYGYAYGDIFQATGWGSYNLFNWLSATVRGVYTWQDRIHGETNQKHETTSPVDFPANYGGRFWDVGFGLNASIPEGRFAGNNFSVEWLQPVATDFNGYQLDRDGALTATWSFSF